MPSIPTDVGKHRPGAARVSAPAAASPDRVAARSRWAGVGVALVLLAVSSYAVWTAQSTWAAARQATVANRLAADLDRASTAVAAQESLELKYRLTPATAVRRAFDAAAGELVLALVAVQRDGTPADARFAQQVLTRQATYLSATARTFAAVDRGDAATATRMAAQLIEPAFTAMRTSVGTAAARGQQLAVRALVRLQRMEDLGRRLTPAVFLLGLLLVVLLAAVSRGYRRMLLAERARALHDSLHDALTGLPNRVLLADRLEQALRAAARTGTPCGLLLIDLDRFKEVNDTFGHHCGDQLLVEIGARMGAVLRGSDTVGRLGGDEFAVLLSDIRNVDDALGVARKVRAALEEPLPVEGVDLTVEASIGVVVSTEHGSDRTTLLRHADIAMYVAKSQHLGVFAYTADADETSPARLALLGELRAALDHHELDLVYQPKVRIGTGELVGAETLVRWRHPVRGLLPPGAFVPLAEQTGLIGPLTHYVVDAGLAQARSWLDEGSPLPVAVNLSARSLLDERLPAQITELLHKHGVPPGLLALEVTESAIVADSQRARRLLELLAAVGVRIAVDDFGVGYTSLAELKSLPVDELKVDRSFVTTMAADESDSLIVRSVIELGHNLGLTIVAEGVEDAEVLAQLAGFGCDVAQGFHIAEPLSAVSFATWRATRTLPVTVPAPAG